MNRSSMTSVILRNKYDSRFNWTSNCHDNSKIDATMENQSTMFYIIRLIHTRLYIMVHNIKMSTAV